MSVVNFVVRIVFAVFRRHSNYSVHCVNPMLEKCDPNTPLRSALSLSNTDEYVEYYERFLQEFSLEFIPHTRTLYTHTHSPTATTIESPLPKQKKRARKKNGRNEKNPIRTHTLAHTQFTIHVNSLFILNQVPHTECELCIWNNSNKNGSSKRTQPYFPN